MKHLQLTLLAASICLFSLASSAQTDKGNVRFEIDETTTMQDLAKIKMGMLEHGAYFQMKDLEFTDEGTVKSIHVTVDFNDGYKGDANVDDFSDGKKIRIIRDHSEGSKIPFCIGQCD